MGFDPRQQSLEAEARLRWAAIFPQDRAEPVDIERRLRWVDLFPPDANTLTKPHMTGGQRVQADQ